MKRKANHVHYNLIGSFFEGVCKVLMLRSEGKPKAFLFCVCLVIPSALHGQCPSNEADLANGGTFVGPCSISVGAEVLITGDVVWNGEDLSILGSGGSIDVQSGGSLTISSGNVFADDNTSGSIYVRSGGAIRIEDGAALTTDLRIHVYGELTIDGTLNSTRGRLEIFSGGTTTINPTGALATGSTGDTNVQGTLVIGGSFTSNGDLVADGLGSGITVNSGVTLSIGDLLVQNGAGMLVNGLGTTINSTGDVIIDNGDLTINNGVTLTVGDDFVVHGGGSVTVEDGSTINVQDDLLIGNIGAGSVDNDGQINAGGDIMVMDTNPDSGFTSSGNGDISAGGAFNDNECDTYDSSEYHFCDCSGQSGIGTCSPTLPITLIDFTAQQQEGHVSLVWSTAAEVGNDSFVVERLNQEGGFDEIITVKGQGTSYKVNQYSVIDPTPIPGNNYYRLKQTDFDGKFSYSDIIRACFKPLTEMWGIRVYPNPSRNESISIELTQFIPQEEVYIELSSLTGVLYMSQNIVIDQSGKFITEIPQGLLPKGMYILKVDHTRPFLEKIVVE